MKKNSIKLAVMAILFVTSVTWAQETIKVPLTNPSKPGFLSMGIINGSITVKGYDGKEVVVTGTRQQDSNHYHYKGDKRSKKGLKRISNNSLEFSATEYDNTVRVKSPVNITTDFEIQVPKNFSLKISTINNGDIYVENIRGVLDVSNKNGKVTLKNISGSVSADTLNDDLVVDFTKVAPESMAFSNLNGDIDVTFPKNFKANIRIKSDRGEVYTDFDLKSKPEKAKVGVRGKSDDGGNVYRVKVEKWITGTINGGGPEILFKNFHGDVIIRSK